MGRGFYHHYSDKRSCEGHLSLQAQHRKHTLGIYGYEWRTRCPDRADILSNDSYELRSSRSYRPSTDSKHHRVLPDDTKLSYSKGSDLGLRGSSPIRLTRHGAT
jgi:hypothetical protein